MNVGTIFRWIISGTAIALWGAILIAATVQLAMHWYLVVLLATAVASGGVVALLADAMARAREAKQEERPAGGRSAMDDESVKVLCAAIEGLARRIENATDKHGASMRRDVMTVLSNSWRGEALAARDAFEAAMNVGGDTGPMQRIR